MFGWLKRKPAPEGPVEIKAAVDVEASCDAFFGLIDFANPQNAKVQLGHQVTRTGEDSYELVMNFMPDLVFELAVEEREPGRRYTYRSPVPEGVGRLLWTHEAYDIEPTGPDSCRVHLITTGEFAPGMSLRQYEGEMAMLALAVQNSLGKLKIHAEGGIDDVRRFELTQAS